DLNQALNRYISLRAAAYSIYEATLDNQPDLALLLAAEAYQISPTPEAQRSWLLNLTRHRYLRAFIRDGEALIGSGFSPDEKTMVMYGCNKFENESGTSCAEYSLRRFDVETRLPVGAPLDRTGVDSWVAAFSRSGKIFVAARCLEWADP